LFFQNNYVRLLFSQFIKLIGGALDMAKCAFCGKETSFGKQLSITRSHISKRTTRTVKPNLRTVKAVVDGEVKRVSVCSKCLRSGKVQRAV
jgi:large subunit ribosomal protein L28